MLININADAGSVDINLLTETLSITGSTYVNTSVDVRTKPGLAVFILKYDFERGADTQSQPEHLELSV